MDEERVSPISMNTLSKRAECGYSGVFGVADHECDEIESEIDPDKPGDQEPRSPGLSPRFSLEFGPKLNENCHSGGRIRGKTSKMGLASRVPDSPGVTDNKTNNVFMISDPKNPRTEAKDKFKYFPRVWFRLLKNETRRST
ncbi:hypothetical protein NQ318_008225 [Aromia moschata]|uniref:Uncharacterized protein n=1 Tax=Aromia moschata TaxID=1265417 RepID=A0AAV8YI14_9CUCU|nr:hypothetical protein NQ318_008225 [Aromia moschata]